MKRRLSLILIIMILLTPCLCACGAGGAGAVQAAEASAAPQAAESAAQTAEAGAGALNLFRAIETMADEAALCRVSYPVLALSGEDAAAYPALARAVDALNANERAYAQEAYDALLPAAQGDMERRAAYDAAAKAAEDTATPVEYDEAAGLAGFEEFYRRVDLTLPRADSRTVSVLYSMTSFSGGVHGNCYYYSANLDSATGRQLGVGDVVRDMAALRAAMEEGLAAAYPAADFSGLEDALNEYMADPAAFTWTLDYQGVTFYFSPGELAPYEDGQMRLSLRFDENPELFSLYYTVAPYSYAVPFTDGALLNCDINGDGHSDSVRVDFEYAADGAGIERLIIDVNGKSYTANTPMTECRLYAVYAPGEKRYLFISAQNLTGYGYISVYTLDRAGAGLVGMLYNSSLYAAEYTTACPGMPLFTDPDDFMLGTRQQYLGTLTGLKSYSLGADGMPTSENGYFVLYGGAPLTLKGQLVTATIDPTTGTGTFAAETFAPGTRLNFLRSDGEGAVDMYTDEGVYCRLYVSGSPGGQNVNGIPAEQLFDGIVY